jgi:hypothetical protein
MRVHPLRCLHMRTLAVLQATAVMPSPVRRTRRFRAIGSGSASAGPQTFTGFIDGLSVWRVALSTTQVLAGMHDTSSQWEASLTSSVDLAFMFEPAALVDMLPVVRIMFDGAATQPLPSAMTSGPEATMACVGVCLVPSPRRSVAGVFCLGIAMWVTVFGRVHVSLHVTCPDVLFVLLVLRTCRLPLSLLRARVVVLLCCVSRQAVRLRRRLRHGDRGL